MRHLPQGPTSSLIYSLVFALAAACGGGSGGAGGDGGPGGDGGGAADAAGAPDASNEGPDTDGDGLSDDREAELGTDPADADSDDDGILDGDELDLGTDPLTPDAACAESSAQATLTKQPVDVILAIDTSGSMDDEIDSVQANLNVNLATILEANDLDYRVVLIGEYPGNTQAPPPGASTADKLEICITEPLGGAACTCAAGTCSAFPAAPAMTDRFKHYDVLVDSRDGLRRIVDDFDALDEQGNPGWGTYLRDGSQKVFVFVTDDDADGEPNTFAEFDAAVLALAPAHFGTADARNYVFHAILGMNPNDPATDAWPPTAAEQTGTCGAEAVRPGAIHQQIAIGTGGLRFPLCDNDNFDVIFNQIATDVVEGAQLTCSFTPVPPSNGTLDFDTMVVYYTEGGATVPTKLAKVADAAACAADSYYVEAGVVTLCPVTCDAVQADPMGQLAVHVACNGPTGPE